MVYPSRQARDFLVNIIDRAKMVEELHRAKALADVTVVSIHWGTDTNGALNNDQKDLAQFLVNEGADIIFGSHPHVLQPMEWLQSKDGRNALVVYSLGNFISGQIKDYKDIGGLVTLDITKHVGPVGNSIELSNPSFIPTYVASQAMKNYKVVPLEKAGEFGLVNAAQLNIEIQNHMTQWIRK